LCQGGQAMVEGLTAVAGYFGAGLEFENPAQIF
jgi:hypothetical protein